MTLFSAHPATASALATAPVSIPHEYHYNPQLGELHDYCTSSPDTWFKADFRGPCARHDLCLERAQQPRKRCHERLRTHLRQACAAAYTQPVKLTTCRSVAQVYFGAVVAANPKTHLSAA